MTIRFVFFCILLALPSVARSQDRCAQSAELQRLSSQGLWNDLLRVTQRCMPETAEVDYYRGLAFARIEQWDEAAEVFASGERKFPRDERFPVELAGIAFKQKNSPQRKENFTARYILTRTTGTPSTFLRRFTSLKATRKPHSNTGTASASPELMRSKPTLNSGSIRPCLTAHSPVRRRASLRSNSTGARSNGFGNSGFFRLFALTWCRGRSKVVRRLIWS